MNLNGVFISNDTKRDILDWFKQGHTCVECDEGFRIPAGTTHDLVVDWWKRDKEKAERRRKERANEKC